MKQKFGLYKSPLDKRDILLRSFFELKAMPVSYHITDKMTPVRSQGQEGACVGFAMVVGVKEYQEQIDTQRFIELSPRFLYEGAKLISGHTEGTTLKAAVEVAKKLGVCEEKLCPYVANDFTGIQPKAYPNALNYRIKTYARIVDLDDLKQAIYDFGACMIGVNVYKGIVGEKATKSGIVPDPTCWDRVNVLGGHALCVVGYNDFSPYYDRSGHIKFKNSWGTNWGDEGYGYLSYNYIKKNMLDAFSCVDITGSRVLTVGSLKNKRGLWI